MNKKQKIVFWLSIVIFIWIGFGGPNYWGPHTYSGTPLGADSLEELDFSEPKAQWPKVYYCFDRFTEILRAWIVLVVTSAGIFYSFKTH
jgi:hypothetical protein